jgi:hypothetical protein
MLAFRGPCKIKVAPRAGEGNRFQAKCGGFILVYVRGG